ncbi:hypothetical protein E4U22_003276 [Claviceps purpurea]|nr:hypothetical protein E4U22_003276 [Claviceps purpurea]
MDQQHDSTNEKAEYARRVPDPTPVDIKDLPKPFQKKVFSDPTPVDIKDLPKPFQKKVFSDEFSAEWEWYGEDIDHGDATTLDAHNRVAYTVQQYVEEDLHDFYLLQRFKEDFEHWTEKSFKLLSTPVRTELRNFLMKRNVNIEMGLGVRMTRALAEIIETQSEEEKAWLEVIAQRRKEEAFARIEKDRTWRSQSPLQQESQRGSPVVATRQQATTTPEDEPISHVLTRQNIRASPIDVSMIDAEYIQASTRDVEMIDAPASERRTTNARYYGGTEYRDPPPDIPTSSAGESSRRGVLKEHIDDSHPSHVLTGPDNKSLAKSPMMSKNQLSYTNRAKQPMTLAPEECQIIPAISRPMLQDLP